MRAIAIVCALIVVSASASAQLNKCVNEKGKVEYRDSPCQYTNQSRGMGGGTVSGVQALSAQEIGRAKAMMAAEQRRGPEAVVIRGAKSDRPSAQDIKDLETAASAQTVSRQERQRRQLELDVARERQAGGSGDAARQAHAEQESQRRARVDAANQANHQRMRQQAAAQAAAATADAQQDRIRTCQFGNCQGDSGAGYRPAPAQPGVWNREDGKQCRKTPTGGMDCF